MITILKIFINKSRAINVKKKFGFYEHVIPERRRTELKIEIKHVVEARILEKDSLSSRSSRKSIRELKVPSKNFITNADGKTIAITIEEKGFIEGLSDCCPRCGYEPIKDRHTGQREKSNYNSLVEHLSNCDDKKKHKEYRAKMKLKEEKEEKRKEGKQKEEKAQNFAAWSFLGATKNTMWMLEDGEREEQLLLMPNEEKVEEEVKEKKKKRKYQDIEQDDRKEKILKTKKLKKSKSHEVNLVSSEDDGDDEVEIIVEKKKKKNKRKKNHISSSNDSSSSSSDNELTSKSKKQKKEKLNNNNNNNNNNNDNNKTLSIHQSYQAENSDLPSNLEALSRQRLISFAKLNGIKDPQSLTNNKIIKLLQPKF